MSCSTVVRRRRAKGPARGKVPCRLDEAGVRDALDGRQDFVAVLVERASMERSIDARLRRRLKLSSARQSARPTNASPPRSSDTC
jgi:hypothetical protein